MATTIITKNNDIPGQVPLDTQLVVGELAVNTADRVLYTKHSDDTVVEIGGGAKGGFNNKIFYENQQIVTVDYEITTNYNAGSFGPITIDTSITVTVPSGSTWTIV
jgi:hypothetical protein